MVRALVPPPLHRESRGERTLVFRTRHADLDFQSSRSRRTAANISCRWISARALAALFAHHRGRLMCLDAGNSIPRANIWRTTDQLARHLQARRTAPARVGGTDRKSTPLNSSHVP